MDPAERFFERFRGYDGSHGRYTVPVAPPGHVNGTKLDGAAMTITGGPTVALWRRHLAGEYGLGVVPATAEGTCRFAAVDVDDYGLDPVEAGARVRAARLPLIVCRSKSGGSHLYLFLSEPVSAALVRVKVREWAKDLGFPNVEVFPKQDRILEGDPDDPEVGRNRGSWINVPYFGGDRSTRYALDESGIALSSNAFLDYADTLAVGRDALILLEARPVDTGPSDDRLPGAPPCLVRLLQQGVHSTGRNEALFNYALYFHRADPRNEEERLRSLLGTGVFSPKLEPGEARTTIRSALRRPYNYRCKNPPLVDVCDRATCLKREHGVAAGTGGALTGTGGGNGLTFGPLFKIMTEPPTWVWEINGERVELDTEELVQQRKFLLRVMSAINVLGDPMRPVSWKALIDDRLLNVSVLPTSPDASDAGQVWVRLQRFCTGRAQARSMDELLLGKPFTEDDRTFFQASDFLSFLSRERVIGVNIKKLFVWFQTRGLEVHTGVLKGKPTDFWSIPAFREQSEPFAVPRNPDEAPF